ncbi:aromatic-ring-hydroxylating dioxygenase subunit beta [Pseudorhodoplanes sp.]|uniref:aromatic-ring-hydroxylating dioxygenase subunit beta n=1 Tax=Pseudorhodoplanes sp. TaxID=1934341 RepID=UPI003D14A5E1
MVAESIAYRQLEDLYARYAEALDDGPLEQWPEFFTENCLYLIIPRENVERGMPLAIMRCESKGMLYDRVTAVLETMMYEPRYLRHHVTNLRITKCDDTEIEAVANFSVIEVLPESLPRILMVGRYLDRLLLESDGVWRFSERHCIYDSTLVPNSIIYPV